MNCPNCDRELVMTDRSGVEIDYCPGCRGVWLDRGELDKIIERSGQFSQSNQRSQSSQNSSEKNYRDEKRDNDYNPHKKKKGFLGDLFDF